MKQLITYLYIFALCLSCDQNTQTSELTSGDLRFVSLSPAITETLFALDLGDQVVGVTDFCRYPEQLQTPEADKLRVGCMNPPLENILIKKPDLVIGMHSDDQLLKNLAKANVKSLRIKNTTYQDILDTIKLIGEKCDRASEAQTLTQSIETTRQSFHERFKSKPQVKVLLNISTLSDDPNRIAPWIVGERSFYAELLQEMNVVTASAPGEDYYQASAETLLKLNPQVIILMQPKAMDEATWQRELEAWQKLPHIEAVQNKQIYTLTGDYVMLPGPRITKIMQGFSDILDQIHNRPLN